MASRSDAKLMRVLKTDEADFGPRWSAICERWPARDEGIEKDARKIIERVREGGDAELIALVCKLDGVKLSHLELAREEWEEACDRTDVADRAAIGKAATPMLGRR